MQEFCANQMDLLYMASRLIELDSKLLQSTDFGSSLSCYLLVHIIGFLDFVHRKLDLFLSSGQELEDTCSAEYNVNVPLCLIS
jgi:hypothetical protein